MATVQETFILQVSSSSNQGRIYSARTDVNPQAYPSTIPSVGGLVGANTIVIPTDFNTPIIRITDVNTANQQHDPRDFGIDSSAEVNFMSKNDDRFWVADAGSNWYLFVWNPKTMQATRMYVSEFPSTSGMVFTGSQSLLAPFWSFLQPYILYTLAVTPTGSIGLYSYDFTDVGTPPLPVLVKDFSTCPSLSSFLTGKGAPYVTGFSVSADDQTFAFLWSSTPGQDSAGCLYMITWNRTNGARVQRSDTLAITGDYGPIGTGTGFPAAPSSTGAELHNVRLSKNGNWLRWEAGSGYQAGPLEASTGKPPIASFSFWEIATLTNTTCYEYADAVYALGSRNAQGHIANGYNHAVNADSNESPQYPTSSCYTCFNLCYRAMGAPTTGYTQFRTAGNYTYDNHSSWSNADSNDLNPVLVTSKSGTLANDGLGPWRGEVIAVAVDGSNKIYRFCHTYNTHSSQFFVTSEDLGAVSQSGNWYAWSSDWNETLGSINVPSEPSSAQAIRGDVFMVQLK